jgi:fatty-acyl-CoA synthase
MAAASSSEETPWVDGLTIGQVLRETARKFPQNDAYVFCQFGVRRTWAEVDAEVDRVARSLLALGIKPRDHFGVWATNVPQWVLFQFATARMGAVLVNVNPAYRANELSYALQQSDVRGLALIDTFRTTDYTAILNQICPELAASKPGQLSSAEHPKLKWVISLRGETPPGMLGWDEFLSRGDSVPLEELRKIEATIQCTDPVNIQYTSGTSGRPKGAMLSHRNILINGYYTGECQRITDRDRICLPIPLYHCFGCVLGTLCCLIRGATMVFPAEGFDAGATLKAIEQEKATALYGVPTMFIAQLEHPEFPQRNVKSLRTGIMSGSPCPLEVLKKVTAEMGASEITVGYGQTEASPIITLSHTDDPMELRVGTVGCAIPGIEVKIIDPETGAALGDNQPGELCSRGHGVMLGYYNMPEKTAEAIDQDGWLHTGDLAKRLPNGYFHITGRLKDMVIRGGENIYPREIEDLLHAHPAVEDAYVVGVPDKKYGEELLAWVKLREGHAATQDELRDFCKASLTHFKVPRYWKFVESFPTTVTGKIQKFKIREQGIMDLGLQDAASIKMA